METRIVQILITLPKTINNALITIKIKEWRWKWCFSNFQFSFQPPHIFSVSSRMLSNFPGSSGSWNWQQFCGNDITIFTIIFATSATTWVGERETEDWRDWVTCCVATLKKKTTPPKKRDDDWNDEHYNHHRAVVSIQHVCMKKRRMSKIIFISLFLLFVSCSSGKVKIHSRFVYVTIYFPFFTLLFCFISFDTSCWWKKNGN